MVKRQVTYWAELIDLPSWKKLDKKE
jgi:hypothetical protein